MPANHLHPPSGCLPSSLGELRITRLTSEHLDTILALEQSAHPHPWSRANFLSSLTSSHHAWGLWRGPELLGHLFFSLAVGEAELLLLVIARAAQGKGLAKLLLGAAITSVRPCARQFFLEVRESNTAAIALYEGLGFNQIGERRNYYPGKNGGETALVYGLDLEAWD